jgi:hypothetical protein
MEYVTAEGLYALIDLGFGTCARCSVTGTLALCLAAAVYSIANRSDRNNDPFIVHAEIIKPEKWDENNEGEEVPKYDFRSLNLGDYCGRNKALPLLICARGIVFDVTSRSDMYGPGETCELRKPRR